MKARNFAIVFSFAFMTACTFEVKAQAASAGAEFNRAERAQIQENARLERIDPPIKADPVGNAILGGLVTGSLKGAAAGATSAVRGAVIGGSLQTIKEGIATQRAENQRLGRGGPEDPRYNPATLFKR